MGSWHIEQNILCCVYAAQVTEITECKVPEVLRIKTCYSETLDVVEGVFYPRAEVVALVRNGLD